MASNIVYKPHCGKCGALIDEDVSFRKIIMESDPFAYETGEVYPNVCQKCGAIFECIEIKPPTLLPTEEIK